MRDRAVDDFAAIRARMDELRRERVRLWGMNDKDGRRSGPTARAVRGSVHFKSANAIGSRSPSPVCRWRRLAAKLGLTIAGTSAAIARCSISARARRGGPAASISLPPITEGSPARCRHILPPVLPWA